MSEHDKGGWLPKPGPIFVENTTDKPITIHKNSATIRLASEEAYWYMSFRNSEYERKVAERIEHPPTEEQWNEYRRIKAAWEIVSESEYFDHGCSCEHPSVREPETRIEYVYAETHAEWLDRCRKIQMRGKNDDQ